MPKRYNIDSDIHKAETLPASFYLDEDVFLQSKASIFASSWQWVDLIAGESDAHNVFPFTLLGDFLDESCIAIKNADGGIRIVSNVCTHRGAQILTESKRSQKLICPYHGRRFTLNGQFEYMPEFKEVADFPRTCDHLHTYASFNWHQFLFMSIDPKYSIGDIITKMEKRIGFLPLNEFKHHAESSKTHRVNAHWALYCDNYLEGFHIPFVHPSLNEVLDYGTYETLLDEEIILQIGYAKNQEDSFDLPADHIDYGKNVAAYYYFVFPNLMLNIYPWGLSVNIVEPKRSDHTDVKFITYVYDENKFNQGAADMTDKVEEEDEAIVESVHRGLKTSVYKTGRYSPRREQGLHHFHRLIARLMEKSI